MSDMYYSEELPNPLDKGTLIYLLMDAKSGNQSSIDKIVEHNLRLALKIAKKYSNFNIDESDLTSLANIALIKAVKTFDLNKEVEFSTYASRCIFNEINLFFRKNGRSVVTESLDEPIYDEESGNELYLKNIISSGVNIENDYLKWELYYNINEIINKLNLNEQRVVKMYYGFCKKEYKQKDISRLLGISQPHVSYILKNATLKIKKQLERLQLIETKTSVNEGTKRNI